MPLELRKLLSTVKNLGPGALLRQYRGHLPYARNVQEVKELLRDPSLTNYRHAFYDGILSAGLPLDRLTRETKFNTTLGLLGLSFPIGFLMARWPEPTPLSQDLITTAVREAACPQDRADELLTVAYEAVASARRELSDPAMQELLLRGPDPSPVTPLIFLYETVVAFELANPEFDPTPGPTISFIARQIAWRHYCFTMMALTKSGSALLDHTPSTDEWDRRLFSTGVPNGDTPSSLPFSALEAAAP